MSFSCHTISSCCSCKTICEKATIVLCPDQELIEGEWVLKYPDAAMLYVDSLKKEGAHVIVLKGYDHIYEDLLQIMDGWLIPGGLDIEPSNYKSKRHQKTHCLKEHKRRFSFEEKLYSVITKKIPILGICYGSQLINILNGFLSKK